MRHASRSRDTNRGRVTVLHVEVVHLTRLRNSRKGNPRWQVVTADAGTFVTEPDVARQEAMEAVAPDRHAGRVELHLNDHRRVVHARQIANPERTMLTMEEAARRLNEWRADGYQQAVTRVADRPDTW